MTKSNVIQKLIPSQFKDDLMFPISSIFDDFFDNRPLIPSLIDDQFFKTQSFPKINIIEEPNQFIVEAGLPGMNKEDLEVEFNSNLSTLKISGKKSSSTNNENKNYVYKELKETKFSRTIQLVETGNLKIDEISSKYNNGILSITIPKIQPTVLNNTIKNINID